MDTDRTAHGCKAGNCRFKLATACCHQIGKFINNYNDIRKLFCRNVAFLNSLIVSRNIADTHAVQKGITALHFTKTPLQSLQSLLWLCDYRNQKVRNIIVKLKFNYLRVNQNQFYVTVRALV